MGKGGPTSWTVEWGGDPSDLVRAINRLHDEQNKLTSAINKSSQAGSQMHSGMSLGFEDVSKKAIAVAAEIGSIQFAVDKAKQVYEQWRDTMDEATKSQRELNEAALKLSEFGGKEFEEFKKGLVSIGKEAAISKEAVFDLAEAIKENEEGAKGITPETTLGQVRQLAPLWKSGMSPEVLNSVGRQTGLITRTFPEKADQAADMAMRIYQAGGSVEALGEARTQQQVQKLVQSGEGWQDILTLIAGAQIKGLGTRPFSTVAELALGGPQKLGELIKPKEGHGAKAGLALTPEQEKQNAETSARNAKLQAWNALSESEKYDALFANQGGITELLAPDMVGVLGTIREGQEMIRGASKDAGGIEGALKTSSSSPTLRIQQTVRASKASTSWMGTKEGDATDRYALREALNEEQIAFIKNEVAQENIPGWAGFGARESIWLQNRVLPFLKPGLGVDSKAIGKSARGAAKTTEEFAGDAGTGALMAALGPAMYFGKILMSQWNSLKDAQPGDTQASGDDDLAIAAAYQRKAADALDRASKGGKPVAMATGRGTSGTGN